MRFLVIGASGFVGWHVLTHVRALGYEALGTASSQTAGGLLPFDLTRDRIEERVPASWWGRGGLAIGVIASAVTQIDRCAQELQLARQVNVDGTIRLINDLVGCGVKPIYLSSSFVFDGSLGYYPDDFPHSPISEYGRHKSEVERYMRERVAEGLTLRLDKIVGDDPAERHLFSEWWGWITSGRPILCIDGQVISPTLVDDIARAVVRGCERGLRGVLNAANPEFFSREELARQFLAAVGREAEVVCQSQEALGFQDLRPLRSYLDSSQFVGATGMRWTPMRQVFTRFMERLRPPTEAAGRRVHYEGVKR